MGAKNTIALQRLFTTTAEMTEDLKARYYQQTLQNAINGCFAAKIKRTGRCNK